MTPMILSLSQGDKCWEEHAEWRPGFLWADVCQEDKQQASAQLHVTGGRWGKLVYDTTSWKQQDAAKQLSSFFVWIKYKLRLNTTRYILMPNSIKINSEASLRCASILGINIYEHLYKKDPWSTFAMQLLWINWTGQNWSQVRLWKI